MMCLLARSSFLPTRLLWGLSKTGPLALLLSARLVHEKTPAGVACGGRLLIVNEPGKLSVST